VKELSKEELIKLYETLPEDTLRKLGIYSKAKEIYEEKHKLEKLKKERIERAMALVKEAQELLNIYRLDLRVTAGGTRVVDKDGQSISSSGNSQKKRKTGSRLPGGVRTIATRYRIPILQALIELGGREKSSIVLDRVSQQMKDIFVPVDLEKISTGGLRWRNAAQWERVKMVEEGLLCNDSPRGTWEITEKGRKYLKEHNYE
jgi:hypothetical protein